MKDEIRVKGEVLELRDEGGELVLVGWIELEIMDEYFGVKEKLEKFVRLFFHDNRYLN